MFPYFPLRPIVLVGIGMDAMHSDAPQRYAMSHSDVDPTAYWGIGSEYDLGTSPLALRVDLRQGVVSGRREMSFDYEATLGVTFDFFRSKRQERARLLQERAAREDTDGDAVLDGVDQCPAERETYNGIDDGDGCPEVDRDHDGLLGSLDRCPDRAEDPDGFEDADGCTDSDNDGDEIADIGDKCPNAAETRNGFEDADGCPDDVPLALQPFTGVITGVQFEANSTTIYVDSIPLLDEAVAVFRGYPALGIEIHGHTDPFGTNQVNTDLSLDRAIAVKAYLVDHGIASDRILTFGHGANLPIANNATPEGRAKNRRIEFRLRSMSAR
jgi:OOP family OmpA-OmpF porin